MLQDKSLCADKLSLGVCYYPEHWDESLWADDLSRMLVHGIETVRVFEFAWTIVEKEEGVFDFSLFDSFLDLCKDLGMKVILCTPTATPPAWLTHKYPEVLNADINGSPYHHGHRRHYNYNSPVYNNLCGRIVTKLAERYGQHPAVIGWQIDNEINCEKDVFYSECDDTAFRAYLQAHFGTLDALNEAIGARFWNQTYTDWDQVHLTHNTLHGHGNPHMALLEKRFFSKSARSFVKMQSVIIRQYSKGKFITTNGIFGHLDTHEMTQECLDFITYDSYPNFGSGKEQRMDEPPGSGLRDRGWSMNLTRARSISPNFGIMEQQSGPGGWDFRMIQPMPKPGQMRLWTMQSVAHGADYISYFRWRTCGYGTEMYWHGLNDYGNKLNRRLSELMEIAGELKSLARVAGSRYEAKVGLLHDYLNEWDGERDLWHGPLDISSQKNLFAAAQEKHTPMNLVYLRNTNSHQTTLDELNPYKVLFYPHATILTRETASILYDYCRAGGVLVLGARTGYKDEYGRCPMMVMPGYAGKICGVEVEDYTFVRPEEPPVSLSWDGETVLAPIFNDILKPQDGGEVLATYRGGYYDGKPAITKKSYEGGGAAYYVGSGFSQELTELYLEKLGISEPYAAEINCPRQVELAMRVKDEKRYCFLLNFSGEAQPVLIKGIWRDAVSGASMDGAHNLVPYGVLVLEQ
jgi:beta-galactosidase